MMRQLDKDFVSQFFQASTSGIFREVADLELHGRVKHRSHKQITHSVDSLVRQGDHVLLDVHISIENLIIADFARTGI